MNKFVLYICSFETMYSVVKVKEKMSSNSPCAACKFLRRKCTQECVFAPYFPPDQPHKFANVHKVYGASNVAKLLNDLPTTQREDAVNSLAYEADARLRDPVYGCVGLISILQHRLKQVQMDLENAKRELANYIGPSAMIPILNQGLIQHSSALPNYNMQPHPVLGLVQNQQMVQDQHQQQQQQQQLIDANDQQQRSSGEVLGSFNGGIDTVSAAMQATASEFSHMTTRAAAMSPCLSLGGSYENNHSNNMYHQIQHQPHHHQLHQLFLQQQPLQPQGAE